jgi:hypothetical protein
MERLWLLSYCCLSRSFRCRCLETNVVSEPFPSNSSFSSSTVIAFSKYATLLYIRTEYMACYFCEQQNLGEGSEYLYCWISLHRWHFQRSHYLNTRVSFRNSHSLSWSRNPPMFHLYVHKGPSLIPSWARWIQPTSWNPVSVVRTPGPIFSAKCWMTVSEHNS